MDTCIPVPNEPAIELREKSPSYSQKQIEQVFDERTSDPIPLPSLKASSTIVVKKSDTSTSSSENLKIRTFEELIDKLKLPSTQISNTLIKPIHTGNAGDRSHLLLLTSGSKSSSPCPSSTTSIDSDTVIKKAKIRSIEELLDSSSDLDLPNPPTPPPSRVSARSPSERQLISFPVTEAQQSDLSPADLEPVPLNIPPNLLAPALTTQPVSIFPQLADLDDHESKYYTYPPEITDTEMSDTQTSAKENELTDLTVQSGKENKHSDDSLTTLGSMIIPETPKKQLIAPSITSGKSATERSNTVSPTPTCMSTGLLGGISINHYERLIEELKCPGCASPMKAPIKLCATGHSICEHCTTVLMLCPLCKEPFTDVRSLTLEAVCSKALFRCSNAAAGCTVRLQHDLLAWHEKQCIWKPMKCFMGRVWGNCTWSGREAYWKEHLESAHSDKVFKVSHVDLNWDLNGKIKSLSGYYVFEVYDEMFNFYQIYDRDRILFTMTITTMNRERKHNFAYEVEIFHKDNDSLSITQRFPVHSEYDADILLDGTCVSINLSDLCRLIGHEKIINYRVRINEVKSPKTHKIPPLKPSRKLPLDFKQTNIEGANLKCVPPARILTRQLEDILQDATNDSLNQTSMKDELKESSDEEDFEIFTDKKWGTPQLNFNRKYLCDANSSSSSSSAASAPSFETTAVAASVAHRNSICEVSGSKNKMKNVTTNLRKSFRSLKTDIIELKKPFISRSSEKRETLLKK